MKPRHIVLAVLFAGVLSLTSCALPQHPRVVAPSASRSTPSSETVSLLLRPRELSADGRVAVDITYRNITSGPLTLSPRDRVVRVVATDADGSQVASDVTLVEAVDAGLPSGTASSATASSAIFALGAAEALTGSATLHLSQGEWTLSAHAVSVPSIVAPQVALPYVWAKPFPG